ncbi:hypothetical protein QE400_004264 [Xanthomonas sacchari]|nr:hypothetical protein [Xanthomonas sacchari]
MFGYKVGTSPARSRERHGKASPVGLRLDGQALCHTGRDGGNAHARQACAAEPRRSPSHNVAASTASVAIVAIAAPRAP